MEQYWAALGFISGSIGSPAGALLGPSRVVGGAFWGPSIELSVASISAAPPTERLQVASGHPLGSLLGRYWGFLGPAFGGPSGALQGDLGAILRPPKQFESEKARREPL